MPTFTYTAINSEAKKCFGTKEALSEKSLRENLRSEGLVLLKVRAKAGKEERHFSKADLLGFTQLLAQLLDAGMPLYESLVTLKEQASYKNHSILTALCQKVHEGAPFKEALQHFPKVFDTRYCAMVQAGVSSGVLPQVLKENALLIERSLKIRKQIMTAILYPFLLGGFALFVIFILLFFVIPSLENLFEGRELSGFTWIVVGASRGVRAFWPHALLFAAIISSVLFWKKEKWLKNPRLYKLPLLKNFLLKMSLSRFFRTLATLQKGGVNLIESLKEARAVVHFPPLHESLDVAISKVIEGRFLSEQLKNSALIPPFVIRMVKVGEETAESPACFLKIAEILEEDVEKGLTRFATLLQPMILIFMGVVVASVMLAVLLPLSDVGNLIQ